jgi:site-specific DNA recombinase
MEQQKRIGIWIRVSTDFQVKDESPETHEKRARLYAEAKGWHIAEVYRLDAVSGKSVMEYPETKRMLHDIKKGHITALIFSKLARLARNTKELLEFADIFRAQSADLVSLAENIDTSSPAGRLFFTIIAAMAEWERDEISARVSASVPIRAELGKPLGGQASYGFKWENKTYIIDETEAPVRKLMYEIFLKCKRKKTTATELNRLGYRTRNSAQFTDSTVSRLLRDPSAKGERRANYTKSNGTGKGWTAKSPDQWIIVPCPAIISEDVWNDCNALLDQQERKYTRLGPRPIHLLAGFVQCTCGKKMYIYHKNNVYRCKPCNRSIPAADLDEIYHLQLKEFLVPSDTASYQERVQTELLEKEKLLQRTKLEETALRKKSSVLLELRLNEDIEPATFVEQHKPIEERLKQLREQLPHLETEITLLSVHSTSADTVLSEAYNLYTQWPTLSFEERRAIVELITDSITIDQADISITLTHLPAPHLSKRGERGVTPMPLWLFQSP